MWGMTFEKSLRMFWPRVSSTPHCNAPDRICRFHYAAGCPFLQCRYKQPNTPNGECSQS